MKFILINGKGSKFTFPVNPEEVTISRQKGYDTVTTLSHGETDFPQGNKIKEISFSSFFPKEYDESYCKGSADELPDPQAAMNTLNEFLVSKTPLRFIITETSVNIPVFVSSHQSTFRGGEAGAVAFELSLRSWTELKIAKKAGKGGHGASGNKKTRTDMREKSRTYTVKPGDSLSKIAKLELGDSSKWSQIYKLNQKLIGSDPHAIKPGQKLVLS